MSVDDSLRRFLERVAELEEHREVRSVVRDEDGEVRYEWRARTLADGPFVDLPDDLAEAESSDGAPAVESTDDAHPVEPTGNGAAGRLEGARGARDDEPITVDPVDPDSSDADEPDAGDEEGGS